MGIIINSKYSRNKLIKVDIGDVRYMVVVVVAVCRLPSSVQCISLSLSLQPRLLIYMVPINSVAMQMPFSTISIDKMCVCCVCRRVPVCAILFRLPAFRVFLFWIPICVEWNRIPFIYYIFISNAFCSVFAGVVVGAFFFFFWFLDFCVFCENKK